MLRAKELLVIVGMLQAFWSCAPTKKGAANQEPKVVDSLWVMRQDAPSELPVDAKALGLNSADSTVVDDGHPGFNAPGWTKDVGEGFSEFFESGRAVTSGDAQSGPATWTVTELSAGRYRVWATWSTNPQLARDASYSVVDSDGMVLASLRVDQQEAPADRKVGAWWKQLAWVNLRKPGALSVQLAGNGNGDLFADAVWFERTDDAALVDLMDPEQIDTFTQAIHFIDDGDAAFSKSGAWTVSPQQGHRNGIHETAAGNGSAVATWTFDVPPGNYAIAATWAPFSNRATDAPFDVYDGTTLLTSSSIRVNQMVSPSGLTSQGAAWFALNAADKGFPIASGQLVIKAASSATGVVVADAIRVEKVATKIHVINDSSTSFSAPGWTRTSGQQYREYYGSDAAYFLGTTPGGAPATWRTPWLWMVGTYEVWATWVPHANRATNARYDVLNGSGAILTTRTVNQEVAPSGFTADGANWTSLGLVVLAAPGPLEVKLSGVANEHVIADAVRFERRSSSTQPPPTPPPGEFTITLRLVGFTPSQELIFQRAADRWAAVIVGDLPNATYGGVPVDDVLIDGTSRPIDGVGRILGSAGPDALRPGTFLPIHGTMNFDSADMASMEASGRLEAVILHEMGHVLGVGTVWSHKGLLTGYGTSNPLFTGAQGKEGYARTLGGTGDVPVESTGGPGTAYGHWRESVFTSELMTGWLSGGTQLSRITVGSLADMGYVVDIAAADRFGAALTDSDDGEPAFICTAGVQPPSE